MRKSYVIQWKSTINGRAGKGTKLFDLEEASQLASELNREYPGIHHEAVENNPPPEPRVPPPQGESEAEPSEAAAEIPQVTHSPDFAMVA